MGFSKSKSFNLVLLPLAGAERFFAQLHQGQVLQGRILWKLPEGKYLVHLLGRNLIARAPDQFSEGDCVTLTVESLGPPVVMALCRDAPEPDDSEIVARILKRLKLPDNKLWRSVVESALRKKRKLSSHRINMVA